MAILVDTALQVSQFTISAARSALNPPADQEVHVWVASLDSAYAEIPQLQTSLSEDENVRAAKFRFEKNRNEFIVRRGMLRLLLASYLNASAEQLRFTYSDHGKPSLAESCDSGTLSFNLSYSEGVTLFAFARGRQVGVDIEKMRDDFDLEEIAERFFSVAERNVLCCLPVERKREAFFNCWTRKEAYTKARGEGLSLPWYQFDVSLAPEQPAALLSTRLHPNEALRWSLCDLTVQPGYAAALAVEKARGSGSRLTTRTANATVRSASL